MVRESLFSIPVLAVMPTCPASAAGEMFGICLAEGNCPWVGRGFDSKHVECGTNLETVAADMCRAASLQPRSGRHTQFEPYRGPINYKHCGAVFYTFYCLD